MVVIFISSYHALHVYCFNLCTFFHVVVHNYHADKNVARVTPSGERDRLYRPSHVAPSTECGRRGLQLNTQRYN